ncbi:MAG: hypothetical protein GY928_33795 [Colwellia sp.]|nr:hypothetical protein [Colwellia sp.]
MKEIPKTDGDAITLLASRVDPHYHFDAISMYHLSRNNGENIEVALLGSLAFFEGRNVAYEKYRLKIWLNERQREKGEK